ncbi:unnamed protein product [Paramecium octaurelia]|uniref:Uncharacterized protein n=1 Tax=Paramecium octaurelia TaxID=43137 RepID=A0A8S1TMD7_PAROT|nr:unnamed protein product [Paramecium octaurelia]
MKKKILDVREGEETRFILTDLKKKKSNQKQTQIIVKYRAYHIDQGNFSKQQFTIEITLGVFRNISCLQKSQNFIKYIKIIYTNGLSKKLLFCRLHLTQPENQRVS